jgi:hypothetical protein
VQRCQELLLFERGGLRSFVISADQAEFLQLVAECVAADIQEFRSVRLVSVGLAHGEFNRRMFDLFNCLQSQHQHLHTHMPYGLS